MARVIEKPRERTIKCPHCFALIGFDRSDVKVDMLWPPVDYPGLNIAEMEPIISRKLICPYCERIIYLNKDYDKEVF